ncbi:MAG: radical SAM protein, partial [Pseudolabrys sp.]
LEGGFLRRRSRRDRRPGLPLEPAWSFYPKYFGEVASKLVKWIALYLKLRRIYLRIKTDPQRYTYTDIAMTAVAADEAETYELFGTSAAQAYVAQAKRVKQIQEGHARATAPMEA